MKKLAIFAISSFLTLGLVACGNSASSVASSSSESSSSTSLAAGSKADGTYTAKVDEEFAQNFGNGWTDQLTVTYKDGRIVSAEFASYNAEGVSKAEDSTYPMTPSPSVWMEELDKNIQEASSPEDIITVAGASTSSENARILLAAIEENGVAGEIIVVTVPVTAD